MNALLYGAASLGALIALLTHDPAAVAAAKAAADDAEVVRLMQKMPDEGAVDETVLIDPGTGGTMSVQTLWLQG